MNNVELRVEDESIRSVRVDVFLSDHAGVLPRNQLKLRAEQLLVNGKEAKLSKRVSFGDTIAVTIAPAPDTSYEPEDISLQILYEDEFCVVLNKPRGMVVHPAAGNAHGTLVQGLMFRYEEFRAQRPDNPIRPGIVHRLDKDTSGVIIAGKDPTSQEYLASQFRKRRTIKKYYAISKGEIFPTSAVIDSNIRRDPRHRKKFSTTDDGGKTAETAYRVLSRHDGFSFVSLSPKTGRTHQLRVHMQSLNTPILGDPLYARVDTRYPDVPLMLHAYSLTIAIPPDREMKTFRAPLPMDFRAVLAEVIRR